MSTRRSSVDTNELFRFTGFQGRTQRGRAKMREDDREEAYARMQENRYFKKSRHFMKGYKEELQEKKKAAAAAAKVAGPKMTLSNALMKK